MDVDVAQSPPPSGTSLLDASPTEKKRAISNAQGEDSSLVATPSKKQRLGTEDMGRVAEIVLVLSAMGRMRGGKDPTEAELALMAEAREKLALICETLAPKDIVANDAIEKVIEELGLKSKDQIIGFKVPKLSIAEKLLFTKRKMEEAKKYPSHTPTYTSQSPQGSFSTGTENRGAVQLRFQSDKISQSTVASGGISPASSLGSVSGGNSGSITYHFGAPNESRTSAVASVLTGNHTKDLSTVVGAKVERTQAVAEGASSGYSRASVLQANSSTNQPSVNATTTTWSISTKSTSLTNLVPEKIVSNQTPGKVQEANNFGTSLSSQAARDIVPRPYITKTGSLNSPVVDHQPPRSVTAVQPSNNVNHNEIAKLVQKWLSPRLPEYPTWTPPSREYMNKALTCQICQMTVNDVESVLLCDACEKGYHLKCMLSQNQRGLPKVEWHCQKCLALSHGKPLPPKYGRVMRSMATSKMAAITVGVHSSPEKKVGTVDLSVNQQKTTSNDTSMMQNTGVVATVDNNQDDLQFPDSRETLENNPSPMNEEKHEKLCHVDTPDKVITNTVGPSHNSADVLSSEVITPNMSRPESFTGETRQASTLSSDLLENESEHFSSLQCDNDQSQMPDCRLEISVSEMSQASHLSSELPRNGSELFSSLQNLSDDKQSQLPDCKAESSVSETRQVSNLKSKLLEKESALPEKEFEFPEKESEQFSTLRNPSENIQSNLPDCRAESSIDESRQASNLSSEPPVNDSEHFPSLQNPSDDIQSQMPDCRAESSIGEAGQASNLSSDPPANDSEHFPSLQNPSDNIQPQLPYCRGESSITETRQASNLSSELQESDYKHFLSFQNPSDNVQSQLPDRAESSIGETRQASNLSLEIPENESEYFSSLQNILDNIQPQLPDYRSESSVSETRQASNISSEFPENENEHFSSLQNPSDNNQSQLPDCADMSVEPNENSSSVNKEREKSPYKGQTDSSSAIAIKVEDAKIKQQVPIVSTKRGGKTIENDDAPPDVLHVIDWTSNVVEIVDGKALYSSCCINGVTYKLKDYALFHTSQGKLEPSLLMAMWEDKATGLPWLNVTRCYFPGDLPRNVCHPFTEANEVFKSNHEDTFMAGLISGPCEVLPPIKYKEEVERRSHLGPDASAGLRPIFLCKWFYDEAKGHFQPISS